MGYPTRTCLACRRTGDKPTLVRLAVVGGTVTVDPLARTPGRGAYLCPSRACLEQALRRDGQALRRALRLAGGTVDARSLQAAFPPVRQAATQVSNSNTAVVLRPTATRSVT